MDRTNHIINQRIEESYRHIKPYMDDLESTKELREMCKFCEKYCGQKHDYTECENMPCFRFWLVYEYLKWDASWS